MTHHIHDKLLNCQLYHKSLSSYQPSYITLTSYLLSLLPVACSFLFLQDSQQLPALSSYLHYFSPVTAPSLSLSNYQLSHQALYYYVLSS